MVSIKSSDCLECIREHLFARLREERKRSDVLRLGGSRSACLLQRLARQQRASLRSLPPVLAQPAPVGQSEISKGSLLHKASPS